MYLPLFWQCISGFGGAFFGIIKMTRRMRRQKERRKIRKMRMEKNYGLPGPAQPAHSGGQRPACAG